MGYFYQFDGDYYIFTVNLYTKIPQFVKCNIVYGPIKAYAQIFFFINNLFYLQNIYIIYSEGYYCRSV